jgi:peptidoglycan/xylan/chitin deacetylase (PgdA/CDA1 family)
MILRKIIISLLIVLTASMLLSKEVDEPVFSSATTKEQFPILMYHKVSPYSHHGGLGLRVSPADFHDQMEYLHEQGYHTVSLDQLMDHWQKKSALPTKPIVITLDDGYEDNYLFAFPILKKFGFTATIFLVYDDIGGFNVWDDNKNVAHNLKLLSWRQIDLMQSQGITFGSHTLTHPNLASLTPDEARREIAESKKLLEEHFGHKVNFIAYPYGRRNPVVDDVVRLAGYRGAVTTHHGKNTDSTDPVQLKRLRVTGNTTIKEFEKMLDG